MSMVRLALSPHPTYLSLSSDGISAAPETPIQESTDQLFFIVLLLAIGVSIVVYGALSYALIRYRDRPERGQDVKPVSHNKKLEVAWIAGASIVVVVIAALSIPPLLAIDNPPQGADYTIQVYAQQFLWTFRYPPDAKNPNGFESVGELWIQEDLTFILDVHSRDVIHSFYVPDLDARIDAIPGKVTHVWIQAREPGRYALVCAEFCGVGHSEMRGTVVVFPAGSQSRPYGPPPSSAPLAGSFRVELRDGYISPPELRVNLGDSVSLLLVNEGSSVFDFAIRPPYNLTVSNITPGSQAWLNFTANETVTEVEYYISSQQGASASGMLRISETDVIIDVELKEFGGPGGRWQIVPSEIYVNPGDRVALRIWNNKTYSDGENQMMHNFTLKEPLWLRVGDPYEDGFKWLNFTAPDEPMRVEYICEVPGHAQLGMVGYLIVGNPGPQQTSTFAFPPYIVILIVIGVVAIVFFIRVASISRRRS